MVDINAMFAEAAGAAEADKDDKLVGGKTPPKEEHTQVSKPAEQTKEKDYSRPSEVVKPVEEVKPEIFETPKQAAEVKKEPIIQSQRTVKGLSVENIGKVIKMKETLDSYDKKELEFVMGYFQKDEKDAPEIIYSALTIERRGLDALHKIVAARNSTAAERAFYLMELDNGSIEAIYEQIEMIAGGLEETPSVNTNNKIQICRTLESAIANMSNDVFKFIHRLQEFTNIAIK